jgi:hypothetical protein
LVFGDRARGQDPSAGKVWVAPWNDVATKLSPLLVVHLLEADRLGNGGLGVHGP